MKQRWWQWLLTGALVIALVPALLPLGRIYRLLDMADIPWNTIDGVEAHGGWYDLLKYTDGSEWAILRVKEGFLTPSCWHVEACTLDVLPEKLHTNFVQACPTDVQWTAWHYVPVDELLPFDDQEWLAAFYDAAKGLLAVYRGYSLYGMN